MEDVLVVLVGAIIGGAVGAFLYSVYREYGLTRRVTALEVSFDELTTWTRGKIGKYVQTENREARQEAEQASEGAFNAAIAEGAAMLAAGTPVQDIVKALAVKYPSVAADLMKKFGGV